MDVSDKSIFDVVIIGGGVIGSSIAYFLTRDSGLSVAVVEPDPSYRWNATPRSAGGIRSQFSTRANVLMSLFGADFIRHAAELLEIDGDRPNIGFREQGYLILSSPAGEEQLRLNHALQVGCGADVSLLGPPDLQRRFPWLNIDNVALGGFGEKGEGWIDPYSLLQAFRRKAQSHGVVYLADAVVAMRREAGRITSVSLQSGKELNCGAVVNAAGCEGRAVAAMAGVDDLPVYRKKRQIFVFSCRDTVENMPLLIDPSGVYCRPENELFICGVSPDSLNDPETSSFEIDHNQFDDDIWPILAARVPRFEAIKVVNAWAGHYDVNVIDHNAILGPHPAVSNFYFANGFSGHGLQHSPAVGRAISELIIDGRYKSLDLRDYRFGRFADNEPLVERNII